MKEKLKNINYIYDTHKKKYSVLILLLNEGDEIKILFELRSTKLDENAQPGDISLPGGLCESDDVVKEALRETFEEVGISENQIEILGTMNPLITGDERYIFPVVAYAENIDINKLKINYDEVDKVFTVPVNYFLNNEPKVHKVTYQVQFDEEFPFDKIYNGKNYKWRQRGEKIYFYYYNDYTIWGITAKIIYRFIHIIKKNKEEV